MEYWVPVTLLFLLLLLFLKYKYNRYETYPDTSGKISVVMCNHARPYNLEKIIPILQTYRNIDEIIVTHSTPNTFKKFKGCINLTNFNEKYGAAERFFAAEKAKNRYILFLDDDHLPSENLIRGLLHAVKKDPLCIYGPYKRQCNNTGYHMDLTDSEDYNIILTCILMTSREVLNNYLENFHKYSDFLEKTKGNGEDITFNMEFVNGFNKYPEFIEGRYQTLDTKTQSYSGKPTHLTQRNDLCKMLNIPREIKVQIPKVLNKIFIQHSGDFKGAWGKPDPSGLRIYNSNLKKAHDSWKNKNPEYKIQYWDLRSCREYLKTHFPPKYLAAFDCIKAYGGKTNFFRYCIVYNEGGWYSDWKQECLIDGLLDSLSSQKIEWFSCWDKGTKFTIKNKCMQNAFFGAVPKHPTLKKALDICFDHIKTHHYGDSPLELTGVCVFGEAFNEVTPHNYDLGYYDHNDVVDGESQGGIFYYKDTPIIKHKCKDCGYGQDWPQGNNYSKMWKNRNYYCDNIDL